MDDTKLIEELLYRGEGPTLDYKEKQYPFSNADDVKKSELLKDILAFSNAWRTETAYILIGVTNGAGQLVELDTDIDDSRLQEFINSKTNTVVSFSYRSLTYNGTTLGLFTIPVQDRPVYIKKKYGRLEANTVYVRRGSATAIADPSEIYKMGVSAITEKPESKPNIILKVVNVNSAADNVFLSDYEGWELLSPEHYPNYSPESRGNFNASYISSIVNQHYYRQMAVYLQESKGAIPFSLDVANTGNYLADDVKIELTVPRTSNFSIKRKSDLLVRPQVTNILTAPLGPYSGIQSDPKSVVVFTEKTIVLTFSIGKLQVGEVRRTPTVFIINPPSTLEAFDVRILSDQLQRPMEFQILAKITVENKLLTAETLSNIS